MSRKACIHLLAIVMAAGLAVGCATPYYSHSDGVYYEPSYRYSARVAYVDPLVYPYWSLDYFYFSRHYHPYSVVVHRYDPWYYPYPGWYYGYRSGLRHRYPWYGHGGYYSHYQPWRVSAYYAFGRYDHHRWPRVRQIDSRLGALESRRSLAIRSQRPDRGLLVPAVSQSLPATSRRAMLRRDGESDRRSTLRRAPPTTSGLESRRSRVIDRLGNRTPSRERIRSIRQRAPSQPVIDDRRRSPLGGAEFAPERRSAPPIEPVRSPRQTRPPSPRESRSPPPSAPDNRPARPTRSPPPAPRSRSRAPSRSRSESDRSGGRAQRERG